MAGDRRPDSLAEFIDREDSEEWSVVIVNQTKPDAIGRMFEELFAGLDIDVREIASTDAADDLVVLFRDGELVATSPVAPIMETLLFVNSDLYTTGAMEIQDVDPPDVIVELSETVFTLQGYPESNVEKLVLILVSRYIEHRAWTQQTGTLRTSFQRLSRLNDEQGTKDVYDRLGQMSGLDVHVYGIPDWDPPTSMGVSVHGIADEEITQYWFVVYENGDSGSAAMLAVKTDPYVWKGFWTFDTDEIRAIQQYIEATF
jgi:DICT domain-containing protein